MLSENMKIIRKSKGLSQEELAVKLNVVRQTISKWEQGLSVPDAGMLISISEALDTPVSVLLGEPAAGAEPDGLAALSERLEVLNLQLARGKAARRRAVHWFFILLGLAAAAVFAGLVRLNSPYLSWDYGCPQNVVAGVLFQAFEWLFIRIAPFVLLGSVAGACLTRKRG